MTIYEKLCRRPAAFRSLTGMSVREFDQLYEQVARDIDEYDERRLSQRERERAIGGGASYTHDGPNRLLMALIWLRVYPTYDVLGFIFGLHKSNIGRNLKPMLTVLGKHLSIEWPDETGQDKKPMNKFITEFPEVVAIVDATEQPTYRPKNKDEQKRYYSGKKKRHTLKTQVTVRPNGDIIHISDTVPGSQHDKSLYDTSGVDQRVEPEEALMGDSGYQGIQHDHLAVLPDKKPKGGQLTDLQKARNRRISKARVVVENTLAQVKSFQVVATRYRHPRHSHNQVFVIVAALVNRRIQRCPLRMALA
jgi:transposase